MYRLSSALIMAADDGADECASTPTNKQTTERISQFEAYYSSCFCGGDGEDHDYDEALDDEDSDDEEIGMDDHKK